MSKVLKKERPKPESRTRLPDRISPDRLTPLSRKYLDWRMGLVVVIGVLLVFTFLHTFATNPVISGYSVVDAETQDTGRFMNMTSLLLFVFAFFGLFIFVISRRLNAFSRK